MKPTSHRQPAYLEPGHREPALSEPAESLIVLSDVHLGSDLITQTPSGAARRRSRDIDRDLTRLIDHYRSHPPEHGRWRMVIAGDLIDFIGMVLPAELPDLETPPSDEERAHGLGSARDHAVRKMRAVAERHQEVFDALARFVAAGHALTIIHGNHDLELFWEDVRDELTRTLLLAAHADSARRGEPFDRAAFLARLEYSPWFFYRDGLAYIEHGHQYDPFCATEHLLAPLSPVDPRRIARGFCDVLLRFVVRQTPGLPEHGHEHMGVVDYLRLGWRMGLSGMAALALRYARAVRELFRLRREHLCGAGVAALRAQHEQAMETFARARRLGLRRVRALWRLQVPPITRTISGILGSLLVDRVLLGITCVCLLLAVAVGAAFEPSALLLTFAVPPLWLIGNRELARRRKIDAVSELAKRAVDVAMLFPAPFIVMGHTHVPSRRPLREDATYINVGCWAEEEGEHRAPRSHLVIHPGESGPRAQFLRWDAELGLMEFQAEG